MDYVYTETAVIVWDEAKRRSTLDKHGLDFADVNEEFFLNATIVTAKNRRHKAIGRVKGRSVVVVFAYLGSEGLSLVTMRPADLKERKLIA